MTIQLTDEQKQIIEHPDGRHARVLAVAGSGKTTTMAHRVQHLVDERGVDPNEIRIVMFNRLARQQFQDALEKLGMGVECRSQVRTFHSAAYQMISDRRFAQWYGDSAEREHLALKRVVDRVLAANNYSGDDIDVASAGQAIELWKGALIPPSRAGYRGGNEKIYKQIYAEFEKRRIEANAITFNDFVPMAVRKLEQDRSAFDGFVHGVRYIIVDEYQDVNYGQQRLVEILASAGADVMVVGDDDQTIYEWRGARSEYIRREFSNVFSNKPHSTYALTASFRFGFFISQSSYNVITHNTDRQAKDVLPYSPANDSDVRIITDSAEGGENSNRALCDEMMILVKEKDVEPKDIQVLGRTFAQLTRLQSEMMNREIPFKVVGAQLFLESAAAKVILDYLRVAASLNSPVQMATKNAVMTIANRPSRYLARRDLERMLDAGIANGLNLQELLQEGTQIEEWFLDGRPREQLTQFSDILVALSKRLNVEGERSQDEKAGTLLQWVYEKVGLEDHYRDYYGSGEDSEQRIYEIAATIDYANREPHMGWRDFLQHVADADSTRGMPDDQLIKMTSIHRVKGLEFDYVFIPDCQEGSMPNTRHDDDRTFDTKQPDRFPRPGEWIENERRLFYVAATRAKKALYIGSTEFNIGPARQELSAASEKETIVRWPNQASRFLEEMELEPTREVAFEVVKAARKEKDTHLLGKLVRVPRKLLRSVKRISGAFSPEIGRNVRQLEEGTAEEAFHYTQTYGPPSPKKDSQDRHRPNWDHIDLNRPRRQPNE